MEAKKGRSAAAEAKWRQIIAKQEKSGLSVYAYCKREKMSARYFYLWRKILRQRKEQSKKEKGFIEISSTDSEESQAISVETPGGYRVKIMPGTAGSFIREIIQAIG